MARYLNYSEEEKQLIDQLVKLRIHYLDTQCELYTKLNKRKIGAIRQMVGRKVTEHYAKEVTPCKD